MRLANALMVRIRLIYFYTTMVDARPFGARIKIRIHGKNMIISECNRGG